MGGGSGTTPASGQGAAPAAVPTGGNVSGFGSSPGGFGVNEPFAFGGSGSSLGALFGIPQAGSLSPQEQSWVDYVRGENVGGNAAAFAPSGGISTGHTQADTGAQAGATLQTMRIDDAMKASSQEFAAAQEAALGAALGGAGSALGGITKLAKGGI